MKVIAAILLLSVMAMCVEGYQAGKNCPRGNCICTLESNPVCSTQGCDYGNPCFLKCAGAKLLHKGPCVRNFNGK